ncbi:iron chelate uptake ABC transporter family permease subunit [Arachnia propionica]|uniref:iron chelate uptake ABC transporter family permease subunit n=1 Tax=Arachnia propionica TaxID=1750 RepID=UPI001C8A28BF|nr:iron chelate uptake ABC transporter family permease subunit [Arachnia propionica]
MLIAVAPVVTVGAILAVPAATMLNATALGDDLGRGLGARLPLTRVLAVAGVTLLGGGAVAMAGPIGFVGLMVPHVVRWFTGPDQRLLLFGSILAAPTLVLAVLGISVGTHSLSVPQLLEAVQGRARPAVLRLLWEWRLPRVLFALLSGLALAVSGAIFQSLTRNPLGSPDVIGFNTGAFTGTLFVTLVLASPSYLVLVAGALTGGMGTAILVYLLAWRRGVQGFRLIVVGIGTAAFLTGVNNYLLIRGGAKQAQEAASWGFGSFSSLGFTQFWPFSLCIVLLLIGVAHRATVFRQLELGDEVAAALGVRVERTRLALVLLGIGLTAAVTAAAGPIALVALVAPQIARRLVPQRGLHLPIAALTGAVLLLAADLIGQRLDSSVGLVTTVLGGGYFLWLTLRQGRG